MNITLKDRVLQLNQEYIFAIYFNISIENINWSTQHNSNKLNNPLRDDSDASLTFKWYGDRLFSRDWANFNYNGDIFKVVGYILNKNSNNNDDFVYICEDILDRYLNKNYKGTKIIKEDKVQSIINITKIDCKIRNKTKDDYYNYNKFGILDKQINKYVESVYRFSINDELSGYRRSTIDPCYKYNINKNYTKLYFPFRNKKSIYPRFITNNILPIDDIHELKPSKDIILIKSIKDKMLLEQFLDALSIKSILLQTVSSESNVLHPSIVKLLNTNTQYNIYDMFDMDKTGISQMNNYKYTYGYIPLYFNSNAKDPTDYVLKFGYSKGLQSFKENISYILSNRNKRQIK